MLRVRKDEYASYTFYDGEVELRYNPNKHVYYLVNSDGELIALPSVTRIVKIIDKSEVLINWAVRVVTKRIIDSVQFPIEYSDFIKKVLDAKNAHREKLDDAGSVGSKAHTWIEKYIKASLQENSKYTPQFFGDELIDNCCNAALSWMKNHDVRWVCTEKKIYSREFQYAGTLDGIAVVSSCNDKKCCPNEFKDRLSLIDWKTSNYLYNEYLYQTAAYQRAFEEENKQEIQDRWIILLGKEDGRFSTWHLERTEYAEDFETFKSCLQLTRQTKSVTNRMKLKNKKGKSDVFKQKAEVGKTKENEGNNGI